MRNLKFIIYLVDDIRIKNMSDGFLFQMFNTYIVLYLASNNV